MSDVVLFEELSCANEKKVAVATLNSPKSLNALSGDMIDALYPQLLNWQQNNEIAMVLLQASGEKAFCAGGDIVKLYKEMTTHPDEYAQGIESYFTREYKLDYLIHTYNKPFLVWGSGIVMGGGLGLMAGASHRVVTETSRIAMPEISIGLYPDVGGSYFLNKMPENYGLFLGLTGASINATDAKVSHLADHFVLTEQKSELVEKLTNANWHDANEQNHQLLSELLIKFEHSAISQLPTSHLNAQQQLINQVMQGDSLSAIVDAILNVEIEDKWFNRAQASLKHGSAISAAIVYQQLIKGKQMSLADCFKMELNLSVKCGKFGEFCEGVRALLIDKDNKPSWNYSSVSHVEADVIDWFFESKWATEQHPLAQLGN